MAMLLNTQIIVRPFTRRIKTDKIRAQKSKKSKIVLVDKQLICEWMLGKTF